MVVLKGFPPSNLISPTIRITDRDLCYPPVGQGYSQEEWDGFGWVHKARKKPMNITCDIIEDDDK